MALDAKTPELARHYERETAKQTMTAKPVRVFLTQRFPLDPHLDPHGETTGWNTWSKEFPISSFLGQKHPQSLTNQGLGGLLSLGKDEVGGSNPPSSSIESLEPQGVRGFLIFWIFVGKPRFPTGFPTNQVQEPFYFIVAMRSLTISGFFCSSGNRACISAS